MERRIDYVLVVAGSEVVIGDPQIVLNRPFRLGTRWQWPSDHLGLLVTLEPGE